MVHDRSVFPAVVDRRDARQPAPFVAPAVVRASPPAAAHRVKHVPVPRWVVGGDGGGTLTPPGPRGLVREDRISGTGKATSSVGIKGSPGVAKVDANYANGRIRGLGWREGTSSTEPPTGSGSGLEIWRIAMTTTTTTTTRSETVGNSQQLSSFTCA